MESEVPKLLSEMCLIFLASLSSVGLRNETQFGLKEGMFSLSGCSVQWVLPGYFGEMLDRILKELSGMKMLRKNELFLK